jgi:hypothetical protein
MEFWITTAKLIRLEDVDITPGGHVVIAGSYVRNSDDNTINFIAEVDALGRIVRITELAGYTPEKICVSAEGSVWSMGQDWEQENVGGDYDILRHYSRDGSLLHSMLSRSSLRVDMLLDLHSYRQRATSDVGTSGLACSGESAGMYIAAASLWVQADPNSGRPRRWKVTHISHSMVTGLAIAGGKVYASVAMRGTSMSPLRAVYELLLNNNGTGQWSRVAAGVRSSGAPMVLLGRDQQELVFSSLIPEDGSTPGKLLSKTKLWWIAP